MPQQESKRVAAIRNSALFACFLASHSLACSDEGTEDSTEEAPIAKGSAHYSMDHPESPLPACGSASVAGIGEGANVPDLPVSGQPPANFGIEVSDGQAYDAAGNAYSIQCNVTEGPAHQVSVVMEGPNTSPQAGNSPGITSVEITGTIGADGAGTGSVTYRTTRGGAGYNPSGTTCTLSAAPDAAIGGFQVGNGRARFAVFCGETIRVQDDLGRCEFSGTISVSNCTTN
jgi:hypothetical protein